MSHDFFFAGVKKALILFDGYCNFCSRSVNFIMDHDPDGYFMFTSLQVENGQAFLREHGLKQDNFDSFILYENGNIYTHSTAALRISRKLKGGWKLFYGLIVIPKPLRDFLYKLFAANRYRLFGKRRHCRIPTEEERARFL
jgi:predicted DCC family thiol-disulfide oxidoreductase YuxK